MSRPDVLVALHAQLVHGHALDALESSAGIDTPRAPRDAAEAFLGHVLPARISEQDGIGLGGDVRFAQSRVADVALVVGDELVQLTAFPDDAPDVSASSIAAVARIRRPSRRRAA